jgi:hypothetical protein
VLRVTNRQKGVSSSGINPLLLAVLALPKDGQQPGQHPSVRPLRREKEAGSMSPQPTEPQPRTFISHAGTTLVTLWPNGTVDVLFRRHRSYEWSSPIRCNEETEQVFACRPEDIDS